MAVRRTKMHAQIIAQANEMGYFPTVAQADAVWRQWELLVAQQRAASAAKIPIDALDALMRDAIESALGVKAKDLLK